MQCTMRCSHQCSKVARSGDTNALHCATRQVVTRAPKIAAELRARSHAHTPGVERNTVR